MVSLDKKVQTVGQSMAAPSSLDRFLAARKGGRAGAGAAWNEPERRKTRRAPLHWTVYALGAQFTHPFRTETRDISTDSLYCVLDRPVTPGETIQCDIVLPTHGSLESGKAVFLRCRAHVVRLEETEMAGHFGVGCTIEDYRLVYGSAEQPDRSINAIPEP